jgi:uncharacterized protein GlcG (DUF336 family)
VARVPSVARLEPRILLSAAARHAVADVSSTVASGANIAPGVHGYDPVNSDPNTPSAPPNPDQVLTPSDVQTLLERAAAAAHVNSAIIAVVDRNGSILGVRLESGVSPQITDNTTNKVFAIDGAVALARTGAFFANDTAPLTSRTIQDISQTTITQRVVQSNPNVPDPDGNSTLYGPGFVAPVGIKGHFPPGIMFTPQVDLFDIEATNRDSYSPVTGTRFNVPKQDIPTSLLTYMPNGIIAPESYGQVTGILPAAQARGIGTLPGGVPLYKKQPNGTFAEVGGIGVFFPGTTGFATEENSHLNTPLVRDRKKSDFAEVAEYMAFVAAGGSSQAGVPFNGPVNGAPALPNFTEPFGRIDLVGITLNIFGSGGLEGIKNLLNYGAKFGNGTPTDGTDVPVDAQGDTYLAGQGVPYGWLVTPQSSSLPGGPTAADVQAIVARGIASADQTRAQIRLPFNNTARMVFAVSDENGNLLGLYRMPDATVFSIDVAVAKARNVAYYDNPNQLQPEDQIKGVPAGTALTARTFRFVSLPFFPEGIDINPAGPGSILTDGGVTKYATNKGAPLPAKDYQSIQGYSAFNPQANFHDPYNTDNQNGVVLFPGSAPLYKDVTGSGTKQLIGGLGVSGDGVFQDDDVTSEAGLAYAPPSKLRSDLVKVRGVRLPFLKFNRNPHIPQNGPKFPSQVIKPPLPSPRK